jgi:hypothetical protein
VQNQKPVFTPEQEKRIKALIRQVLKEPKNKRSAEINMSPQYSMVQSPSSVYFDVSAELLYAGL